MDTNTLQVFHDSGEISDYAASAVAWALENGIITGYTDSTFRPRNQITRAEMAAIMVRYYNSIEK